MSKDIFYQAFEKWIEHCRSPHVRFSSFSEPIRNCDAYRKIVSMGYEALPLIRQVYDRDSSDDLAISIVKGHGLVAVVREILGDDFSIPKEIRGHISAIEDYTKRWLDENMNKYVPNQ